MNETISADHDYSGSPWASLIYYGQENSSLDKRSEAADKPSDQSETMEELDDDTLTLSYITGQIENPTKADRDRIAKVDLAKVRAEGGFEQRLNAITRSHLEIFLADQIESKARADEILENISDDELMSAYESLDHGGADSIDGYIQFMAGKMDIPFRDQICLVEDETLDDALGAVWVVLDDDSDDSEIIVAEIATNSTRVGEAFWRVATESGSQVINRSDCESLIRYGNQYVDAFGGTKLNNTVCQENFIKVAGKQVSSTEYPYDDLMTIYIQTGDKCLVAPFYEGFYGIQGYSVMDGNCAVTVKSVGVIDE